jgi:hypothetical protein
VWRLEQGTQVTGEVLPPASNLTTCSHYALTVSAGAKLHQCNMCVLWLQVMSASQSVHLIPSSFPALRHLHLFNVQLGSGELFSMLAAQAPCPLTSLTMSYCKIKDTAVDAAASALARLPSLTAFNLMWGWVPLRVASQLPGLTHLDVPVCEEVPAADVELVTIAARNPGLQSLTLAASDAPLSHGTLKSLLTSCANIRVLDLSSIAITDQHLDILLRHGTNITDLTLGDLKPTVSRAGSTCRWQRLWLTWPPDILDGLAYLPLKSVQELKTGDSAGAVVARYSIIPGLPASEISASPDSRGHGRCATPAPHKPVPFLPAPPSPAAGCLQPGGLPSMEEAASNKSSAVC